MNFSKENIVGEVVAKDFRTASVFKSHRIDFCCKGNRSINEVCIQNNLNVDTLVEELNQVAQVASEGTIDFQSWDMDLLADYIEKKHHRYVEKKIPELRAFLNKIAKVHGDRHPELIEIEALFTASANELTAHMEKEETILFPYVRKMASDGNGQRPPFGTIQNPITMMMHEHDNEGERFRKIAALSDNYNPPQDACTTYRVAFAMLSEFENDLHKHIHLENNILFPKAIQAERTLVSA
ncbi:MAG: iron-sulfur cluster repair di-iron protein [Lewinella sp.]|jgi:regulator of cell morphogenesis and NO signaling|uniref:iron-sulfur cluster repair di-iron protein n=1 Tax=Lewinella sp. TaxID=2004506 RepID=UPI003D6B7FEE